jgi:hypothetical protein
VVALRPIQYCLWNVGSSQPMSMKYFSTACKREHHTMGACCSVPGAGAEAGSPGNSGRQAALHRAQRKGWRNQQPPLLLLWAGVADQVPPLASALVLGVQHADHGGVERVGEVVAGDAAVEGPAPGGCK